MQVTSNSHVAAIVTKPEWLEAINQWHTEGGWSCAAAQPSFGLPPDSWRALQLHLLGSGRFENLGDKLKPTVEGRDFLVRVNELRRAIDRESKQDIIVTQTLDSIPRGPAVDIGCGPGHSALRLARLGFGPVYAYDLSPLALEIARAILDQENKGVHLYAKDATSLAEIESGSLAVVYSRGAFHYFRQKDFAKTLNRTLRPGGHVVAEIVGLRYYLQAKHLRGLFHRQTWWHPFSYSRTLLRTLIYESLMLQPRLAAGAPEIGYTNQSIHRFARWAGLKVVSIGPAPSSVGYFVAMRKPDF
jgi:SAM-dependent methyltransferase